MSDKPRNISRSHWDQESASPGCTSTKPSNTNRIATTSETSARKILPSTTSVLRFRLKWCFATRPRGETARDSPTSFPTRSRPVWRPQPSPSESCGPLTRLRWIRTSSLLATCLNTGQLLNHQSSLWILNTSRPREKYRDRRIVRASDTPPVDPNFQLIGDVLEHRPITKPSIESVDSEYLAAEREVPNEEWNKANRDYETANLDLQKAQKVLEGAQAHGKKKDMAVAEAAVEDAQKKVEDAHRKLDSIPKTILKDVTKPYSYTRKTIDLSAIVDVGFRIVDSNGNTIANTPSVKSNAQKQFIVLENVKSEDTKGVKQAGASPDEAQFLTDVEIAARIALIKDVKEKVESLPSKILAQARKRLMDGDTDGTAESYILYLNSTPDAQTAEREEAKKFLREQFNMNWPGSSA